MPRHIHEMRKSIIFTGCLLLIVLLTACRTGTDRNEVVQLFVFWLIILAPILAARLKNKRPIVILLFLVAQAVAYIFYEAGVSKDFNIRPDLFLVFVAVAWNVKFLIYPNRQ